MGPCEGCRILDSQGYKPMPKEDIAILLLSGQYQWATPFVWNNYSVFGRRANDTDHNNGVAHSEARWWWKPLSK